MNDQFVNFETSNACAPHHQAADGDGTDGQCSDCYGADGKRSDCTGADCQRTNSSLSILNNRKLSHKIRATQPSGQRVASSGWLAVDGEMV